MDHGLVLMIGYFNLHLLLVFTVSFFSDLMTVFASLLTVSCYLSGYPQFQLVVAEFQVALWKNTPLVYFL